jgi:hypothetical protein
MLVAEIAPVSSFSSCFLRSRKSICRTQTISSLSQVLIRASSIIALDAQARDDGYDGLGEYDPSEGIKPEREVVVGDPQIRLKEKERSVTSILKELAAIQQQGPQKYCILGTRHCSYLHQQIIELLYVSFLFVYMLNQDGRKLCGNITSF